MKRELELTETLAPNGTAAARSDLKQKVADFEAKGWTFEIDEKKKIFEAKLPAGENVPAEVTLTSNASLDNLLLQIERFYEDAGGDALESETLEETTDEKPKKKLPKTAVAQCRVELSRDDLIKRGDSLSKALDELRAAETRYKSELKALTNERDQTLTEINQRITKYNLAVSTKSEWRDIVCHLEWDFEKKIVSTIRPDTGEVVKSRPMLDDELQMELFD